MEASFYKALSNILIFNDDFTHFGPFEFISMPLLSLGVLLLDTILLHYYTLLKQEGPPTLIPLSVNKLPILLYFFSQGYSLKFGFFEFGLSI